MKQFFAVLLVCLLFGINCFAQSDMLDDFDKKLKKIAYKRHIPVRSIDAAFSSNNNYFTIEGVPAKYANQFKIASSFYPELLNCKVQLEFKKISTTMVAQPKMNSIFGGKHNYTLAINTFGAFEGILFQDIPFNAQIGLICHELAHVLDYENKKSAQIISTGLKYLTKKGKHNYEKFIDYLTIKKGLGWQLYDWAKYAMYDSKATDEYKQFKKDTYMEPEEIEQIMKTLN